MEKKFGPLSAEMRSRIESANARQLVEWSERILTAESTGQIFGD